MLPEVRLSPIGVVHTTATNEEIRERRKGIASEVEVFGPYAEGLEGIDRFSHIFVMCYLDRLRPEQKGPLRVRPRGLLRLGFSLEELPLVGVFALDSPSRPNPVSLSLVPLVGRKGRRLVVSGLDIFDETPVLDIKPYQRSYRAASYRVPEWHRRILRRAGYV